MLTKETLTALPGLLDHFILQPQSARVNVQQMHSIIQGFSGIIHAYACSAFYHQIR